MIWGISQASEEKAALIWGISQEERKSRDREVKSGGRFFDASALLLM